MERMTVLALQQMKREGRKIVGVVAYDYPTAQIADRAGVDLISVGDSVGANLWGQLTETEVTVEEMLVACKAVNRGAKRALVLSTPEQIDSARLVAGLLGERAAGLFPQAVMHVPIETARAAREEARRLGADCAVAIGGGSTSTTISIAPTDSRAARRGSAASMSATSNP